MLRSIIAGVVCVLFSTSSVVAEPALIYTHDQDGNSVSGSLVALVDAARAGSIIRVRYQRSNVSWLRTCNSVSLTLFDQVIAPAESPQIAPSVGATPAPGQLDTIEVAPLGNTVVTCFIDNAFDTEEAQFGRRFAQPPAFERIILNSTGVRQVVKTSTDGEIISNPEIMEDRLGLEWIVLD